MFQRRWLALLLPWLPLLLRALALAFGARHAQASDAAVQNPCGEAEFDSALGAVLGSGGGTLTFNCVPTTTISLSSAKTITAAITIDGGGTMHLSGGSFTRLFNVDSGARLTLKRIVIQDGFGFADGGAILNDGDLVFDQATFQDNRTSPAYSGGAIVTYGPLTITNSLFDGELSGNVVGGIGGGAYITGSAELTGMLIFDNQAFRGGGLFADQAFVNVVNSTLAGNAAVNNGGGIYNRSNLLLSRAALRNNHAGASGGALYQDYVGNIAYGTISKSNATVEANSAADGGAYSNGAVLSVFDSAFSHNQADRGAGISANGTTLSIQRSALWGNQAQTYGGALALNFAGTTLVNTTLSGNSAGAGGGGAIQTFSTGPTKLLNVTISHNSAAAQGGGLHILPGAQPISLTNTLIGNSLSGGNCYGSPSGANYSLSDDVTCTLTGDGNQTHEPLQLSALGNYGGPTPVHMPKATSPAIDSVGGGDIPPIQDQRGLDRPKGAGYDIGAVERQTNDSDLAPRIFLPLARR